jgi:hypothetical protein
MFGLFCPKSFVSRLHFPTRPRLLLFPELLYDSAMVKHPASLFLRPDDSSINTKSSKVSASLKSSGLPFVCQTSINPLFRTMGRLGIKIFRSPRKDDVMFQDVTGDDSTTPTRCTASSSLSSKDSDMCLLIPDFVSTKVARKSCLKMYSHTQNDNSMSTINYDHEDSGTGSNSLRKVSWDTVQCRTYETILGDNPSVSAGAPIGLGWKYDVASSAITSIDDYEDRRGQRRSKEQFLVPLVARERVLLDMGYSRSEISDAAKAALKVKHCRQVNARAGFLEILGGTPRRKSRKTGATGWVDE